MKRKPHKGWKKLLYSNGVFYGHKLQIDPFHIEVVKIKESPEDPSKPWLWYFEREYEYPDCEGLRGWAATAEQAQIAAEDGLLGVLKRTIILLEEGKQLMKEPERDPFYHLRDILDNF